MRSSIERTFALVGALAIGIVVVTSTAGAVQTALINSHCGSHSPCAAYTNSGGGAGIQGSNTNGGAPNAVGVLGTSRASVGVQGTSTRAGDAGVAGEDDTGDGVYGFSRHGTGVFGETGASGGSNSGSAAVVAQTDSHADMFFALSVPDDNICSINSSADLTCDGSITGSALRLRQRTSGSNRVLAYPSESTSATLEDVGTAHMIGGVANVYFERDFASTIKRGAWYYVFLTPLGNTRGLYVSQKTSGGFQVRETERGRSTLDFDYRIVARPLGANNDRLPPAPAKERSPARLSH